MSEFGEIEEQIKESLSEKRFLHTLSVANEAKRLAKHYNADENAAYLAGLVHDCAKEIPKDEAFERLKGFGYEPDSDMLLCPGLWHGPLGMFVARERFGIDNTDVLNAVCYHSTGRADMSLLEKIIYLADFIEPLRSFDGVEEVRELAYKDIDAAALCEAEEVIVFTIEKHKYIHPNTLRTRNDLLIKIRERNINEG